MTRTMLRRCGWELRRVESVAPSRREIWRRKELEKWLFMAQYRPATVLDIGANDGLYAELVRELLPQARILSFEPLAKCIASLQSKAASLGDFQVFPYALGAEDGESVIHHNEFSPSSSLLEMERLHAEELPKTSNSVAESIQIRRLDGLFQTEPLKGPVFIKIDVQGYTEPVLRGGEQTIRQAHVVVAEVSVQPLYKGETTFEQAYDLLRSWGFKYRGNADQWTSPRDGRILQCDCIFEKM